MAHTSFQYDEFPRDTLTHIRLMKVVNNDSADVEILIQHFTLDKSPQFTAISYLWGDPTKVQLIVANGRSLGVTRNVLGFLHEAKLRLKVQDDDCSSAFHGWIWIDAICINQEDLDERASQVQYMREIYEAAKCMIIWLGDVGADGFLAMKSCQQLAVLGGMEVDFRLALDGALDSCEFVAPEHGVRMATSALRSLSVLLSHPYWSRVWIIQEASTPKINTAWICVANNSMALRDLTTVNIILTKAEWRNTDDTAKSVLNVSNWNMMSIRAIEDRRIQKAFVGDSYALLVNARDFYATDPRDKLYAVLGLADDRDDLMLEPNYRASIEEVLVQCSMRLIGHDLSLECLGSAGLNNRHYDVPSWVVDWTVDSCVLPTPFHRANLDFHDGSTLKSTTMFFGASAGIDVGIGLNCIAQRLSITGFVFDAIAKVSQPRDPHVQPQDLHLELLWQDWTSTARSLGQSYVSGGSIFEAFSKVIRADYGNFTSDWNISRGSNLEGFTSFETNVLKIQDRFVDHVTWFRRLIITEKGHLGIADQHTAPGDAVCILGGSTMPMILRRTEDEWSFIGQAYIHGIMDGEAVATTDLVGSMQTFSIR